MERYPVSQELIRQLTYPELICPERATDFQALHQANWNTDVRLTPYFTLYKVETDFTSYTFPNTYDVIYFDAFAPEKQPEMWTQPLFDTLYRQLNSQGILTTYCAKGAVRRMLQAAGFTVENGKSYGLLKKKNDRRTNYNICSSVRIQVLLPKSSV